MKKALSILLTLSVMASSLPMAMAAENAEAGQNEISGIVADAGSYGSEADGEMSNDELFAGYVEKLFYGDNGIALYGSAAGDRLTGLNETIYNELKGKIEKVASGEITSTKFTITADISDLKWTLEDLGITYSGSLSKDDRVKVGDAFAKKVDTGKIIDCLLGDCPYELYWYDKTAGTSTPYEMSCDGTSLWVTSLTFQFKVADNYAPGAGDGYTVNTTEVDRAKKAVTTAQTIASKHQGEDDRTKLTSFKDEICTLTAYNTAAAEGSTTPYGDPWQLVYVFDGDDATNVVCEGYAKAFQYLCDLSKFNNATTACYTVTGTMSGGTGAGNHMWNVVKLNGRTLLVDVTNCDEGTIGYPDQLFLVGVKKESPDKGQTHSFEIGSKTIKYVYSTDEKNLYCDDYLALSSMDDPEQVPVTPPTAITGLVYDGTMQRGVNGSGDGYYTFSGAVEMTDAGTYKATAMLTESKGYVWSDDGSTADKTIEWSIAKKAPVVGDFYTVNLDTAVYTYGGDPVTVDTPYLVRLTGAGDITVKYNGGTAAPVDAGEYTVTFDVAEGDNFTAGSDLPIGTLKISKADYSGETVKVNVRGGAATIGQKLSLPGLPEGAAFGAVTVKEDVSGLIAGTPALDGSTLIFDTAGQEAGAVATIAVAVTGAKNYNDYEITVIVTAMDKEDAAVTLSGMPEKLTYGDTFTLTAKAENAGENGVWTWTTGSEGVLEVTGNGDTATVKVLKAGTSGITAEYVSDATMGTASTGTVTVSRRSISVKADDKSMTVGDALPELTVTCENLVEGDTEDVVFATKAAASTEADGKTVGSFSITATAPTLNSEWADKYEIGTPVDGTLTVKAKSSGGGSSSGGSSSGGSSSSGSTTNNNNNNNTTTTTNADGSTTTTETKPDGTMVKTTTNKDGSTVRTETKPDGSSVTERREADGSTGTVKTGADGKTEAETKISEKAVEDAKKNGEAVTVPVDVKAGESSNSAPTVKIELPAGAGETKIEIPVSNANSGTVAIIVHPDGTEEIAKTSTPTENGVQLSVSGNTTVKLVDNSKDFGDTRNHWSKDEVNFVAARDLFNGIGNGLFGVSEPMTRGMVNTVLARLAGVDTEGGATWYEKGTEWAKANGVSDGTNPQANVTREQLAAMLYRYAGSPAVDGALGFDDAMSVSEYAKNALVWAVQNGIINGVGDNRVAPQASAERAQVAAMMARFLKGMA